jgi:hypothetical protein
MGQLPPGLDPEYIARREAREARRRELEQAQGFSDHPAQGWSRSARKTAHQKTQARRHARGTKW